MNDSLLPQLQTSIDSFNQILIIQNTFHSLEQVSVEDLMHNKLHYILQNHLAQQLNINYEEVNKTSISETIKNTIKKLIEKIKQMIDFFHDKKEEIFFHLDIKRKKDIERLKHLKMALKTDNPKIIHANLVLAIDHQQIKQSSNHSNPETLERITQLNTLFKTTHHQFPLGEIKNIQHLMINGKIDINQVQREIKKLLDFYEMVVKRLIQPLIHFMRNCFRSLQNECKADDFLNQNNRELQAIFNKYSNNDHVIKFTDYYKMTLSTTQIDEKLNFQFLNIETINPKIDENQLINAPKVEESESLLSLLGDIKSEISKYKSMDQDIKKLLNDGEKIVQRDSRTINERNGMLVSRLLSLLFQHQLIKIGLEKQLLTQIGFSLEQLGMLIFKNLNAIIDKEIKEKGPIVQTKEIKDE